MMVGKKLGFGYATDRQLLLGERCIAENNMSFPDGPKSVLLFNGVSSYTEMARELGVDLSIHAKILGLDVEGSIRYTNYLKETHYSKSFIFNINAQLPSIRLNITKYGDEGLTPDALNLYQINPHKFLEVCGDQFVIQESLGAALFISTKLDFITRTEKNTFTIEATGLLGAVLNFLRLGGEHIISAMTDFRVSLSIAVLQKGGSLDALRRAVPELTVDESGFGVLSCFKSGDNVAPELERCKGIMNKTLDYASTIFPSTVSQDSAQALVEYKVPYDVVGISTNPYVPSKEVLQIRAHLKALHQNLTDAEQFLSKLLYEMPAGQRYLNVSGVKVGWNYTSISPEFLPKLYTANATISKAIKDIELKDQVCYDYPPGCTDFTDSLDLGVIQIFQRSYMIQSNCNGTIYGPRYLLPIGNDFYKEDSKFQSSLEIESTYQILATQDSITVILGEDAGCKVPINRNAQYDLVDVYYSPFSSSCAAKLCPAGKALDVVGAEFISTETPI